MGKKKKLFITCQRAEEALTSENSNNYDNNQINILKSILQSAQNTQYDFKNFNEELVSTAANLLYIKQNASSLHYLSNNCKNLPTIINKSILKALYLLKAKGILPEEKEQIAKKSSFKTVSNEIPESYISAPFGENFQILIIAERNAYKQVLSSVIYLNIHGGIKQFGFRENSYGQYKKELKDMFFNKQSLSFVSISYEYIYSIIKKAYDEHSFKENHRIVSFLDGFNEFTKPDNLNIKHPIYQVFDSKEIDLINTEIFKSKQLLETNILKAVHPTEEYLHKLFTKLYHTESSGLILSSNQKLQREDQVCKEMAENYFTESVRQNFSRQLLDVSLIFNNNKENEFSKTAFAIANQFKNPEIKISSIPLAVLLFEKFVGIANENKKSNQPEKPEQVKDKSIILTP